MADRKQAEEQLQFQAAILRYVTDSVIVTDVHGTITYWNEGASAVFGYTASETIGKSAALLSPERNLAQILANYESILAGHDYIGEWQGRRKDGATVWVDVKTTILHDIHGTVIGLIGISKDITARKEAEERLRQGEKHFRALIENMEGGIALTDASGIITYVSPSTTRMIGILPEEFTGRRIFERMVYSADQEAATRLWARVLEEPGKSHALEYRSKRKNGSFLWIEVVGLNLLHEPGIEAIVWNYRDVTERKQLTEEVTRAKEQLEAILLNVADGIVVVDGSDRVIYANDSVAHHSGFPSAAAMLASSEGNITHRHDMYAVWDEWGRPLPASERPAEQAFRGKTAQALIKYQSNITGHVYWSIVRAHPIFDEQGQVQSVVSVYTDVTEQKELEQRKDHFISMASHELRTPLTVLNAYTQLLHERFVVEDRPEAVLYLSKMNDQISKLTKLVVDLLDISKMQAGQIEMAWEAVDMDALAREVVESLQPTTGHHLLIEGEARGNIAGDRERLGQVLMILLNNAIKYSPQADTVVVRIARACDMLTVAVQDCGIGIGKEHLGRLFERFFRVLSKKDKTYPGLGIGLYIAHEIILRHGGKMWVESVEESGSTFFFSLPG
jgi:PAS domain S-box-containing protein